LLEFTENPPILFPDDLCSSASAGLWRVAQTRARCEIIQRGHASLRLVLQVSLLGQGAAIDIDADSVEPV